MLEQSRFGLKGHLSIDKRAETKGTTNLTDYYKLYRYKLPYIIEDWTGINMNYYTAKNVPNSLIVNSYFHIFSLTYLRYRQSQKGNLSKITTLRRLKD